MRCPIYSIKRCLDFCYNIFEIGEDFVAPIDKLVKKCGFNNVGTKAFSYWKSSTFQYGLAMPFKKDSKQILVTNTGKKLLFVSESNKEGEDYAKLKLLTFLRPYIFRRYLFRYNNIQVPEDKVLGNRFKADKFKNDEKINILDLYHEDLIKDSSSELLRLMDFLEASVPENYIFRCSYLRSKEYN